MATSLHEHEPPTVALSLVPDVAPDSVTVVLDPHAAEAHTTVLPRLDRLQVGPAVVGQAAVGYAEMAARLATVHDVAGGTVTGRSLVQAEATRNLRDELTRTRQALGGLDFGQQMRLDEYLDACVGRASERAGMDIPNKGHNTWAGWLAEADDKVVLDVMAAHELLLQEQTQSPVVTEAIAEVKNDFIGSVGDNIAHNRLHPEATAAIDAVKSANVKLGDPWDTWVLGLGGYHIEGGENEVVLAQSIRHDAAKRDAQNLEVVAHILPHELAHLRIATGWPRWRREATVEHLTASARHGDFDDVASVIPGDGHYEAYRDERLLLHALLTLGRNWQSPALVTRAASAQSEQARASADAEMRGALDMSWGIPDVLGKVDRHVSRAEAWLARTRPELDMRAVQDEALRIAVGVLERESAMLHAVA